MAWHQISDKPLSGPMMAYFTDAYMCHMALMSWPLKCFKISYDFVEHSEFFYDHKWKMCFKLPNAASARKEVISKDEIKFNHNPTKSLTVKKKRAIQNGQTPNIIGICPSCVYMALFEPSQILLHTQMDSPWWHHQMETFSASLVLCAGNSPVTGEFPCKGHWRGALMISLICTLNKRLIKHSWGWWFEASLCPLWRHCKALYWWVPHTGNLPHTPSPNPLQQYQFTITFKRVK